MRIDKFLKVSRILKRRTVAQEAASAGKISVNGREVKPSFRVKAGDVVELPVCLRDAEIPRPGAAGDGQKGRRSLPLRGDRMISRHSLRRREGRARRVFRKQGAAGAERPARAVSLLSAFSAVTDEILVACAQRTSRAFGASRPLPNARTVIGGDVPHAERLFCAPRSKGRPGACPRRGTAVRHEKDHR